GNTASASKTATKDTVAPTVTVVSAVPSLVGSSGSTTITWRANENGSFSVRVGGTDCSTGTQVASGSYSTQPNNTTSTVNASDLNEGVNTIRLCVTDATGNTGSTTTTVTKDTSTSTSLASNNNPSTFGQSITFTATVTAP